ncbi:LysR family transcriptional regulator [Listeria weihenstephanensis FSL R9-0317]|uniref:LysR family transcriptional regulator n=1 Tax=Listeria weihenstephanensis TaxID=1006155 RepID=A0A1S7FR33_9LIST|nr:LysR family transcriptional regulator [Listeria weihenstephanensis]AQY49916.1 LysR family transcriptional regulator [Listeria weihenstephanensis]EUJ39824.1 LysR family transcriptional regulator [Listeria weihenstephanensis FSL R9-0317]
MNLRQLHYFRTLAKLEHYTQAAAELGISQPSLSHAISELEKDLNTYLFEKQGRNVKLTKYGRFFLPYVTNSLAELERGEEQLRKLTSATGGVVDLAFIYTLGAHFVPTLIREFAKIEPDITFSLQQGTTNNLIQGLKEEKYDIALCSMVTDTTDVEFIPIVEEELVVIVPLDHPLAHKSTINLKDTQDYPFISFSASSGVRPLIDSLFREVNITPNIKFEVEEDSALAGLVAANQGIAVIPRISTLTHYPVAILTITEPAHQRFIYITTLKNHYLPPAVKAFQDFAISYARKHYLEQNHRL